MAETKKTNNTAAKKAVANTKEMAKEVTSADGRKNMNIKARRVLADLMNIFLLVTIIVNILLWLMDKEPIGQRLFATEGFQKDGKLVQFVFGLLTVVIFATMIGFVINIFFWATDKDSLPVMLTKMIFNK